MKELVLKDVRLLGFLNIILLGVGIFLGASGAFYEEAGQSNLIYGATSFIGIYIILINLSNKDVKFNAAPFMLSLPAKRFDFVKARYITVFFYTLSILGVLFLSSAGVRVFLGNSYSYFRIYYIILAMSLILLFASVNIPFQYFNQQKAQIFNMVLYALVILSPRICEKLGLSFLNPALLEKVAALNLPLLAFMILLISLTFYIISMFLSRLIYERKEF